ncbi:hypothetical protein GCM10022198_11040 [Klugiella xanthotipulae]|uniref:O-antigen/teichoic acid export membrane protein n=1 Tax=Klugiella xanthotipulae TaxID=244735 RepID=A0A543HYW1_9MICO|nr:hypothetical protein [Klugiella xanthotipulae]TQM63498.1 hypothetical protein FB466_1762 [Klugiella xanthotipulae]
MKRLLGFAGQAGGISLAPLLVSIASVLTVPVIIATRGGDFWVSVAVGQAIGEIARSICTWGYYSRIAPVSALSIPDRLDHYFESIVTRLLIVMVVVPVMIVVMLQMSFSDPAVALFMVLSGCFYGLSANWYFIAGNEPRWLIALDALPRALTLGLAAVSLLVVTGPAGTWVFGGIVLLGNVVSVVGPYILLRIRRTRMRMARAPITLAGIRRVIVEGFPSLVISVALTLRLSLPVTITPIVAPAAGASVALADKLLRWINTAATPLMQVMQARVPQGKDPLDVKIRRALGYAWILGGMLGVGTALVVPVLGSFMSLGVVDVGFLASIPIGISLCMIFVSAVIGLAALTLLGKSKNVALVSFVALGVLAATIVPLVSLWGAAGAFWALALAEVSAVVFQHLTLWRELRDFPARSVSVPGEAVSPEGL